MGEAATGIRDINRQKKKNGNRLLSPFVFRKNMELCCDNGGKELTQGAFLKLERGEVINSEDRAVILALLNTGYATRRTLNIILGEDKDCKKSLSKLVRNNVVMKYHYVFENDGFKSETVCFYALSGAAKKVSLIGFRNTVSESVNRIIRGGAVTFDDITTAPVKVLRTLELNNFDASFMRDYSEKIEKKYCGYTFKNGENTYKQQYMYKVSRKEDNDFVNNLMIIPVCIRRNAGWRKELFSILSHIQSCMNKDFKGVSPVFVVNTEDNYMACEAEQGRSGYPVLNTCAIFYISDWTVNNSPILDNLVHVTNATREAFDILSLNM